MTKLKNTKKGMAKKALSISLVAAMLATSNVPVWAAEFTDGTDAVVEAPVVEEAVDTFSAEAEAPVVEEEVQEPVALQANESKYSFADVKYDTDFDWGRTKSPFTEGAIKDEKGNPVAEGTLHYAWQLDGMDITGWSNDAANLLTTKLPVEFNKISSIGSKLSVRFYEKDKADVTVAVIDLGTVQAKDIATVVKNLDFGSKQGFAYTGDPDEIKKTPVNFTETASDANFTVNDFDWNFNAPKGPNVGTVYVEGILKSEIAEKTGYAGSVKGSYEIVKATDSTVTSEWFKTDITITDKADVEYVNLSDAPLSKDRVTVKIKGTETVLPVKSVAVNATELGDKTVSVTLDKDALNKTGNFNLTNDPTFTSEATVKIVARDLSKGTAKVTKSFSSNYIQNSHTDFMNDLKNKLVLTGADGRLVTPAQLGGKVTIELVGSAKDYIAPKKYENAIKISAVSNQKEVNGTVFADLIVSTSAFSDDANFVGTEKVKTYTSASAALKGVKQEYTGKEVTFTNKQLGYYFNDGKNNKQDLSIFDITYDNNINASTSVTDIASITVTGKAGSSYEGCFTTVYFAIKPANVTATGDSKTTTVTTAVKDAVKGVEINPSYTKAEEYKSAIGLAIKAKNGATPAASFDLADGTDYTCEYSFVDKNGAGLDEYVDDNATGNQVKVVATVKNKNFAVTALNETTLPNGVKVSADATKKTVTLLVPIVDKTIAGATIELEKDSYTFTGEVIKPVITVKDGDTILKEGKHYEVRVKDGVHAGTATVIVIALADSGYREGSTVEKNFTITKAAAKDVKVEVSYEDGEIKYDGTAWDGKRTGLDYTATLNGVNVEKYFKVKWGENVDAGKTAGKLTLIPTTTGAKDFEGTKEATFEIKGKEITTGELKLYDDNGSLIETIPDYFYSGRPVTFAKTKFTADASYGKLVEGKDYEIKYIDNVAAGTGYVCVVGKGNYTGSESVTADDGTVIDNIIENTIKTFKIKGNKFAAKDVTVKNGVYASGLVVKPNVTVVANGSTLAEGVDYKLVYDADKAINATTEANIRLTVKGINGYNGVEVSTTVDGKYLTFGIDKFDLANASVTSDGKTVTVRNGNVVVPSTEYTSEIKDGKATVTATTDNKNYTGTKTVDVTKEDTFVEAPVIKDVKVVGNKATVILEGECDGATGYDYVISTNGQSSDKNRLVNKNVLATDTTFQYLQQGIYYAHCHAWKKVNGKKVFSAYSEARPFSVTSITPDQPSVTSVKISKNTVKVTYTKSANATGYDLVLGKSLKKVNGEMRPVDYGKQVKKVYNGNTVTATFTKVPKGTYYVGLHAYNRTSEDGKKVFSPWSNAKKVVVK